jgi:hypothetical protein
VRNIGGSLLHIEEISVDQATPSEAAESFQIIGDGAIEVEPERSAVVALRFAPQVPGAQRAVLSIHSNDPRWPVLPVAMQGTAEPAPPEGPHIVLSPLDLNFGTVPLGQQSQKDLQVTNGGSQVLEVSGLHIDRSCFAILEEQAFQVQPSEARPIHVTYKPSGLAADRATLSVSSNDPQQPMASVTLRGTSTTCAVATAAHGSPLQKDLYNLRRLRDQKLVRSNIGRRFTSLYYRLSPRIAAGIASRPALRALVRTVLRPAVSAARLIVASERAAQRQRRGSQESERG